MLPQEPDQGSRSALLAREPEPERDQGSRSALLAREPEPVGLLAIASRGNCASVLPQVINRLWKTYPQSLIHNLSTGFAQVSNLWKTCGKPVENTYPQADLALWITRRKNFRRGRTHARVWVQTYCAYTHARVWVQTSSAYACRRASVSSNFLVVMSLARARVWVWICWAYAITSIKCLLNNRLNQLLQLFLWLLIISLYSLLIVVLRLHLWR
jgi:hypothetical protein